MECLRNPKYLFKQGRYSDKVVTDMNHAEKESVYLNPQ